MKSNRAMVFSLASALVLLGLSVATLGLGDSGLKPADLLRLPLDPSTTFVLRKLRGPRLATAILVGALLGIAGLLFQKVTRNPLGSPDVIGISAGAKTGIAVMTLAPLWVPTPVGAALGAGAAALLVYLATGTGFRSPTRTIIAGIAVAALGHSITHYIVSVKLRESAHHLTAALSGSLNSANLRDISIAALTLAVVLPLGYVVADNARMLGMGDEVAAGLGAAPDRTRTAAIVLSVVATAGAVAAAGPIAFVALTAPHIATRIVRSEALLLMSSALTGAVILVSADLIAQHVKVAHGLPVGVLTLGVGGVYLGYLLVSQHRKGKL